MCSGADEKSCKSIDEWKQNSSASLNVHSQKTPVIYKLLTFETEIPSPYLVNLRGNSSQDLPPPPQLAKYNSPLNWSPARKSLITWLSCAVTCFTAYSAGAYNPGADQMRRKWGVSLTAVLLGITTFTCGFAIAPMVLAPFSELNGRKPVFIATGALFVISQLCCGLTNSYAGFLVARFFVGVGGSTFSTMVGGVVSDLYASAERNTPMSYFSGAALFGTGLGPLVSGFIAQHLSYRWMFYVQTIVDGTLILILALCFDETRGSVLLSRKARELNKWYAALEEAGASGYAFRTERFRWKVATDEQRDGLAHMIRISLSRPFHLLCTEPILFSFSLWVSFSWAVLYLTLAAIPLVYREIYHFNTESAFAVFASISIAALIFTPITVVQEHLARKHDWFHFRARTATPEHRLLFACVQSFLLPAGLFVFGWTARADVSPALPALGIALATMGIFSIYLATFNYLADVYGAYASSALAAQSFCRNVAAGVLPLVTGAMFHRLGVGPASSLLAGVGVLLGGVPWALLLFGDRVRGASPFAVGGGKGG
jgi:multidrug resistance protein